MAVLYLLRHGETEYTVKKYFCGVSDPPLSALGRQSAKKAAKVLEQLRWDKAYSSPMLRCRQTLEEACRDYEIDDSLKELNFGVFEGTPYGGLYEDVPNEKGSYFWHWNTYAFPEGSSIPDFFESSGSTVLRYLDRPEENILLATHAGFIGAAIGNLVFHDISKMFEVPVHPAQITKVWRENGAICYDIIF